MAHAVWNLCALLELNYPDMPAIDEEVFKERAAHWQAEKEKRQKGKPYPPCGEPGMINPPSMDDAMGCHTRCVEKKFPTFEESCKEIGEGARKVLEENMPWGIHPGAMKKKGEGDGNTE